MKCNVQFLELLSVSFPVHLISVQMGLVFQVCREHQHVLATDQRVGVGRTRNSVLTCSGKKALNSRGSRIWVTVSSLWLTEWMALPKLILYSSWCFHLNNGCDCHFPINFNELIHKQNEINFNNSSQNSSDSKRWYWYFFLTPSPRIDEFVFLSTLCQDFLAKTTLCLAFLLL